MIGGWLIDRENTHDTMKNLLTVPVSYPKLLGGKLAATALLSLLFGLYSAAVTVLTGMLAGLPGLTPGVILQQGGQVVAAALTTFLVCMPMVLIFGQMRGAYLGGSILAFFLLGAALIAVGVFLSSLTDNQGLAAGLGIAVILLNYYSVSLSEYVSSTPVGALAALLVLILAVGAVVRYLTRNSNLAYGVCLVLLAAVAALYFVDSTAFEGLLPSVMSALSLFERFYTFVNGVFDLTAVFYYLTVAALFLFLSVQSLEKRRYN